MTSWPICDSMNSSDMNRYEVSENEVCSLCSQSNYSLVRLIRKAPKYIDILSILKDQKKRELEQLARDREQVRVKETGLMDAIATMEGQLLDQEQYFKREKAVAESSDPARRGAALKGLREKELAWAESRAT